MFKNLIITSILGAIAVILGAFGSHGLKETLTPDALESFSIGVRYHSYYVIILLIINIYYGFSSKEKNILSLLFFLGILFFSGSIYLIQLTSVTAKSIWFITPLGGLFFVLGWMKLGLVFYGKLKNKTVKK